MKIRTFSSGSKGNAALVWQGGTYILVDAGISLKRLQKSLAELEISPEQLSAVVLTHEHTDHINGLPMLMKHFPGLKIISSGGTIRALIDRCGNAEFSVLTTGESLAVGEIELTSFETPHDTAESVGYTFFDGTSKLAFATDLGHISPSVRKAVIGADTVLLESNHDIDMLWMGSYTYPLKRRILSDYGHLSNAAGAEFAVELGNSGTSRLILAHLSEENNRPELAFDTVSRRLGESGFSGVSVEIAPPRVCGEIYEV
jgi:phosphoribosyl 1,2-cyclic phosphodiesterase